VTDQNIKEWSLVSPAAGFSEVRSSLSHNLRDINYAARLWQVFKAIISGALNELKELLGDAVSH
jgi:hypothetical protein